MLYQVHCTCAGFELTTLVVIAQVVVNPTTLQSRPQRPQATYGQYLSRVQKLNLV